MVLEPTPRSRGVWEKRGFKQSTPESKYLAKESQADGTEKIVEIGLLGS